MIHICTIECFTLTKHIFFYRHSSLCLSKPYSNLYIFYFVQRLCIFHDKFSLLYLTDVMSHISNCLSSSFHATPSIHCTMFLHYTLFYTLLHFFLLTLHCESSFHCKTLRDLYLFPFYDSGHSFPTHSSLFLLCI